MHNVICNFDNQNCAEYGFVLRKFIFVNALTDEQQVLLKKKIRQVESCFYPKHSLTEKKENLERTLIHLFIKTIDRR